MSAVGEKSSEIPQSVPTTPKQDSSLVKDTSHLPHWEQKIETVVDNVLELASSVPPKGSLEGVHPLSGEASLQLLGKIQHVEKTFTNHLLKGGDTAELISMPKQVVIPTPAEVLALLFSDSSDLAGLYLFEEIPGASEQFIVSQYTIAHKDSGRIPDFAHKPEHNIAAFNAGPDGSNKEAKERALRNHLGPHVAIVAIDHETWSAFMNEFLVRFDMNMLQQEKDKKEIKKEEKEPEAAPKLQKLNIVLSKEEKTEIDSYKALGKDELQAELKKKEAEYALLEDTIREAMEKTQKSVDEQKRQAVEDKELMREQLKLEILRGELKRRS